MKKFCELFNKKPTDDKWIKYCKEKQLITHDCSPASIASLLRSAPYIDKNKLGEYFGADPVKYPMVQQVLDAYTASFDFTGLNVVQAMRIYLESFKLPGESLQIDRIMESLSKQLYKNIFIFNIDFYKVLVHLKNKKIYLFYYFHA